MALEFKIESKIDISGNPLYLKDVTGEYDVNDNLGGWGPPNPSRSLHAVMAIVEKIVHADNEPNTFLTPITNQISYNPAADDTYETSFEFQMENDGGHIQYFILLPVSNDGGINSLEGTTIQENQYFYMTDGNVYQKQVGDDIEIVEDYSVLIDNTNNYRPTQANCQRIWTPKLSTQEGKIYNDYRKARKNCDNEREILLEGIELHYNLVHAAGGFYQGLQLDAEDTIETQRAKYGL
jgi:hypothetical protein